MGNDMLITDAHSHLVWPNPGADPWILDPQAFIDSGVISKAWVLSTGDCMRHPFPDQNEAVLDLARRFPDFCIPFAYVDFEKEPEQVDRYAERGFAGLKAIFPHKPYDDESFFPFYEKAENTGCRSCFTWAAPATIRRTWGSSPTRPSPIGRPARTC